jgi:plastocyanin
VHHDLWDFDLPSPVVLFDQSYNGVMRKGIAEGGKTGWVYILDRTNGKPLIGIEEKPVEQEPRNATSPTQPYPIGDAVMAQCPKPLPGWPTKCIFGALWDVPTLMSPGGNGGINWANMAYNPQTGWFYVSAADRPSSRIAPGSGVQIAPALGAKNAGTYTAIDSRTNKIVWQKPMPYSIGQGSGTLATASGLLFHGEPDGRLEARDAKTGDLVWAWQTGAGADAPAVTYEIDGEQFIAVAAGGVSQQTTSANGDMVWSFSLKGAPGDRLRPFPAPPPPPSEVGFVGPITATTNIKLGDYSYSPQRVTVAAGATITFTNSTATPHNAAGPEAGGWDTGLLAKDQSATITFNTPGTYHYSCTPHPFMIGEIIVTAKKADAGPITGRSVVVMHSDAVPGTVHAMEHAGR